MWGKDMTFRQAWATAAIASGMMVCSMACDYRPEPSGPMETLPVEVPLGHSERANMEMDMAAGEFNLEGGATDLLNGTIEYNVPSWKPVIDTSMVGNSTAVTIKQPEGHHPHGNTHYIWDLKVNNKVLLDLGLNCGAGHDTLRLGDTRLRTLNVHIGAGQVDVDLRGHPTHDYDVAVSGGVGQATVHLPQDVGIRAEAHGGIGQINVTGLEKKGDHWENATYDTAKVTVRVKVEGGIGQISILAD
jgi:hypothetical protein